MKRVNQRSLEILNLNLVKITYQVKHIIKVAQYKAFHPQSDVFKLV